MNPLWILVLIIFLDFIFTVWKFWYVNKQLNERWKRHERS